MTTYAQGQAGSGEPTRGLIPALFTLIMGLISLGVTHQVLTGWLALGPRANISRHDLNSVEISFALAAFIIGLLSLSTAYSLFRREEPALSWVQWVVLLYVVIGFAIAMSAILGAVRFSDFTSAVDQTRLIIGLGIFGVSAVVYRLVTRGVEDPPEKHIRNFLADSPSAGAIIGFVAIFIGFSMASPQFLEPASFASILTNTATKGIIAIGITILMISGEFDLSVGSVVGVSAMAFIVMLTEGVGPVGPQSVYVAAIFALLCASLMGLINGLLLVTTRIPSFIVTLGTLFAFRAISLVVIAGGRILRYADYYDRPPMLVIHRGFLIVGAVVGIGIIAYLAYYLLPRYWAHLQTKLAERRARAHHFAGFHSILSVLRLLLTGLILAVLVAWMLGIIRYHISHPESTLSVSWFDLINGQWRFTLEKVSAGLISIEIPRSANFRMVIVYWLILVALFQIILMNTPYGNHVFATGGNIGAARAQGINANRVKIRNFILCSFLAGVGAIFEVARSPSVQPLMGNTWELEIIAMTVIGGTLLTGGYGSIIGTMLGVLIFGMLQTGLVLVGMDSRMFQGVIGAIMIIAVILNNITKRTR